MRVSEFIVAFRRPPENGIAIPSPKYAMENLNA